MFGPNPIPLADGKDSKFNYFPGQMHVGTRVNVKVPIQKVNKKKPETANISFEGYGNLIDAMTLRMKEYFDKVLILDPTNATATQAIAAISGGN